MRYAGLIIAISIALFSVAWAEPYWVYFSDKGFPAGSNAETIELRRAENRLSNRCLERRAKARGNGPPVDFHDIAVPQEYIDSLERSGADVRVISRWLNAVSVDAPPDILEAVSRLPFVERISPVLKGYRIEPMGAESRSDYGEDYGSSRIQNEMVNSIALHRLGFDGSGVLMCITDTGFKLDHSAMSAADIIARYDFVGDDSIVSFEPGDAPGTETHGTKTWSVIT